MGFQFGLSGMNAASKNLDVIGNNIANANTTGFKSSRTEFTQMFGTYIRKSVVDTHCSQAGGGGEVTCGNCAYYQQARGILTPAGLSQH